MSCKSYVSRDGGSCLRRIHESVHSFLSGVRRDCKYPVLVETEVAITIVTPSRHIVLSWVQGLVEYYIAMHSVWRGNVGYYFDSDFAELNITFFNIH